MKIPIFNLEFDTSFVNEYKRKCEDIFTSNRPLGESYYVKKFEEKFSDLINCKYSIAVSNGTAAIDLALRALEIKGKVAIPSNTFFATSVAVENAGCEIVLVDCESNSFSICPNDLKRKIKNEKIEAVIIVHIGGIISTNIEEIVNICNRYHIPIIEDAAHAHLSKRGDYKAGTIGEIGCFSFFPTKVMTTGEGGIITTNNEAILFKLKSLKNFGRDINDAGICINRNGINYKINEFTGLLGSMECERVESRIEKRNILLNRYVENLKGSGYIPIVQDNGICSYYKFITLVPVDREKVRNYCKNNGITLTGEVYKKPVHKQPIYIKQFEGESLPVTDYISENHICPPLYPELKIDEIDYVCEMLINAENELLGE